MRLSTLLRSPNSWVALVWIPLGLLTACSDGTSPEQQVRAVIQSMEAAAEKRDVGGLMEHISANYRDGQGQDRAEASRYARGYFITNQSVHLLTRIEAWPGERVNREPPASRPTSTTSTWCWFARATSGS
jgi:hypothetical protein